VRGYALLLCEINPPLTHRRYHFRYNLSTSGWTSVGDFVCSFRISAQVYLEESDIDLLGRAVLDIIGSLEAPAPTEGWTAGEDD